MPWQQKGAYAEKGGGSAAAEFCCDEPRGSVSEIGIFNLYSDMSHLGPWHLGKASSLQLSKTLICISLPRLLLEISSSGRWAGGRRIGGEGERALTLHAPAPRQQQGNCTRGSIPLGKNCAEDAGFPVRGAARSTRLCAGKQQAGVVNPIGHSQHGITKGTWISMKNVSSASVRSSAVSHLPCRDGVVGP